MAEKRTVMIAGAGPAGLAAGLELLRRSDLLRVVILESSDRIGGLSATVSYKGNLMDLGGHRYYTKNSRVSRWWDSVMSMPVRKRLSRIYYDRQFFDYPIALNAAALRSLGLVRTAAACGSYLAAKFNKRPDDNLENFYINRFGERLYRMFFEKYTEKLWGRSPRDISAAWGTQRVKGLSIASVFENALGLRKNNKETSLISSFQYPDHGVGELWERAAAEFEARGGLLLRGCRVVRVNSSRGRVVSVGCEKNGTTEDLGADYFISSMPLCRLLDAWRGETPEPRTLAAASRLPYRSMAVLGLLVKRLALEAPDNWIYVQDPDVKLGRVQIFNNWSRGLPAAPDDTIWLGLEYFCGEDDDFWRLDERSCAETAAAELERLGFIARADVLDYHRELVPKAYPAYFDSYEELPEIRRFLDRFDNLFCVGRNGQHRYNNMDHSVLTGLLAADSIIGASADKERLWNVNAEDDYLEGQ